LNIIKLENLSSCDFDCNSGKVRVKASSNTIDSTSQNIPNPYNSIVGTPPTNLKEGAVVVEVFNDGIGFWKQTSCDSNNYTWSSPVVYKPTLSGSSFLFRDETSPTYTLALSDAGYYIRCDFPITQMNITIPDNATVPFPIGTVIELAKVNTGDIELQVTPPVVINSTGVLLTSIRTTAKLIKVDTDEWDIVGDLI
jgi:hypothetical protein